MEERNIEVVKYIDIKEVFKLKTRVCDQMVVMFEVDFQDSKKVKDFSSILNNQKIDFIIDNDNNKIRVYCNSLRQVFDLGISLRDFEKQNAE